MSSRPWTGSASAISQPSAATIPCLRPAKWPEQAQGRIRVCHVPKTIDNDLPLPGETPTFGFETARQLGSDLVQNLMEDSRTTGRWYFVVVMGRSVGHLALGIGKSTGATVTLIPEEFPGPIRVATVCDILEGAMLKRKALWNRSDGVAVIAEGLLEHMPIDELKNIDGVQIVHDSYGHLRLAEVDLAYILKTLVEHRFASRGATAAIVHKNIGYELRSAAPVAFDCDYVRTLGYGAVEFLLNPSASRSQARRGPGLSGRWPSSNTSTSPAYSTLRPGKRGFVQSTFIHRRTGSRANT